MAEEKISEFLAKLGKADPIAWEKLQVVYGPEIHRFIDAQLRKSNLMGVLDGESIFQSMMIKLFELTKYGHSCTFESLEKFLSFLRVIARNKLLTRARRKRPIALPEEGQNGVADQGPSPSWHLTWDGLPEQFVRNLCPMCQQIFRWQLAEEEEHISWKDIGIRLGKPASTVRVHYMKEAREVAAAMGL